MIEVHLAATMARTLRGLVGIGAACILAVVAGGCVGSQAPAPTPDPFAGLADRSDQAFRQGLEAYGQGQYRDALISFEQARTLSPTGDPRIDQMIERSKAALAPTPTPIPPTPTAVPVPPTATPVAMSTLTPDTDLGRRYFGKVTLAIVPGRDSDAPAASQFFFQDQIGLHIAGLKQHLRLPFTLRVFNVDTGRLVGQVNSEDVVNASSGDTRPSQAAVATATALALNTSGEFTPTDWLTAQQVAKAQAQQANSTPVAGGFRLARFWDSYVWYHQGGEEPGRYRVELYANGVLTNNFDYTVGTVPVAAEVPPAPALEPSPSLPTMEPAPKVPAPAPAPSKPAPAPAPAAPAPPVKREPTPIPSPTPVPTPATAAGTIIGGMPAGLDINPADGRVFIADGSGVVWVNDPQRPTTFNRPINLDHLPVDLAIDKSTGYVFVSARNESSILVLDSSGRRLKTIPMPVAPGDVQVDSELGLAYVVLPQRQALGVIDARGGRLLRTVDGMPQVTSLALDSQRHTLYATHLGGQLTVVDVPSSQVTGRMTLTGAGLSGVATARGLAYAINTATHELAVVEPVGQDIAKYVLPAEPAAIAAAEDSGAVYVLASRPNTVLRVDPTDGTLVGQVLLADRSGRFGVSAPQSGFQSLRSRIALSAGDERLFITLPEAGSLSIVPPDLFPQLTHSIPWVQAPEEPVVAATIPGVIRPGAGPLPDQPAPARAQAQNLNDEETN